MKKHLFLNVMGLAVIVIMAVAASPYAQASTFPNDAITMTGYLNPGANTNGDFTACSDGLFNQFDQVTLSDECEPIPQQDITILGARVWWFGGTPFAGGQGYGTVGCGQHATSFLIYTDLSQPVQDTSQSQVSMVCRFADGGGLFIQNADDQAYLGFAVTYVPYIVNEATSTVEAKTFRFNFYQVAILVSLLMIVLVDLLRRAMA